MNTDRIKQLAKKQGKTVTYICNLIDLMVNSVTVWDEPDGYRITTAYNLTSCKTKTFQATPNSDPSCGEGFGFGTPESTIERISEPFIVWGTVFVQTRRHSLP